MILTITSNFINTFIARGLPSQFTMDDECGDARYLDMTFVIYAAYGDPLNGIFIAYPVPAGETLYIENTSKSAQQETTTVQVFDLFGQTRANKTLNKQGVTLLDVSQLPEGLYLLKFMDGQGNTYVKHISISKNNLP